MGAKLINKGGDGTDVGSVFQIEVLQESKMMIPDCHRRLAIAHADLLQLLVSNTQSSFTCKKKQKNFSMSQQDESVFMKQYFITETNSWRCRV